MARFFPNSCRDYTQNPENLNNPERTFIIILKRLSSAIWRALFRILKDFFQNPEGIFFKILKEFSLESYRDWSQNPEAPQNLSFSLFRIMR